jgi:hypothetical protein
MVLNNCQGPAFCGIFFLLPDQRGITVRNYLSEAEHISAEAVILFGVTGHNPITDNQPNN